MNEIYDAVMIVSFGGPEGMDDVMPFLDRVLRGKNVPESRKKDVAHHYELFNGVSPINQQNRDFKSSLEKKLKEKNIQLPIYWGNRNWKPYITDAIREMKSAGVQKAIAYLTSAYGSFSGCRQYLEDIKEARNQISDAPEVFRLPFFYNHPKFIEVNAIQIQKAVNRIQEKNRKDLYLVFTAHSIPESMSQNCPYVSQLRMTCSLVAHKLGIENWKLAFQSRSGPPTMPWLGPDICDELQSLSDQKIKNVVVSPIGFLSDHMEVLYDLDVEAKKKAEELHMEFVRAETPGNHPLMVDLISELIEQQLGTNAEFVCKLDCCRK